MILSKEIKQENQNNNEIILNKTNQEDNFNDLSIYDLINSVFKDKSKKREIIEKLRPFFSLKVIPNREIDKVYSAIEKIDLDKVDIIEEFKYQEEKYDSSNLFETKSKSIGLSAFDVDLSLSIFGHKQSFNYDDKDIDASQLLKKKILNPLYAFNCNKYFQNNIRF